MMAKKSSFKTVSAFLVLAVFVLTNFLPGRAWAEEVDTSANQVEKAEIVNNIPEPSALAEASVEPTDTTTANKDDSKTEDVAAPVDSEKAAASETSDDVYGEARKPAGSKFNIDANPVTGSFNYSYPINIPRGRNGFQPDLQLAYNNQDESNISIFGSGWSINIPYIERINKKGVNTLFTENYFNSSQAGELVQIGTSTSFGPKVDNGEFLKYQLIDNTWQVTDKNGYRYIYGSSTSARQDNPASSTQIFKWMLEKVIDPNDNYIAYNYYKDQGQIYPESIKFILVR